jgi:hypothetical protein
MQNDTQICTCALNPGRCHPCTGYVREWACPVCDGPADDCACTASRSENRLAIPAPLGTEAGVGEVSALRAQVGAQAERLSEAQFERDLLDAELRGLRERILILSERFQREGQIAAATALRSICGGQT